MDTIWDGNPSKQEVIDCCGGNEKTNDHAEQPKKTQKTHTKTSYISYLSGFTTGLTLS